MTEDHLSYGNCCDSEQEINFCIRFMTVISMD